MPILFDPNNTQKIILATDRDKSPAPAAICKVLTGKIQRDLLLILADLPKGPASITKLFDALDLVLIRFDNLEIPAGQKPIEYLTSGEADEIISAVLASGGIGAEDKKKSDS